MLHVVVKVGDILDERVDVLISSANPDLNMSGGVNGAILLRGGQDVQDELKAYLREGGVRWVEPGSVVQTGPGPLAVKAILHAVAIDRAYRSDTALVLRTIERALREAAQLGAETVALPALATGYGRLPIAEFAKAIGDARRRDYPPIREVRIVLRHEHDAAAVKAFAQDPGAPQT